ncbi:MAG: phosphohydrolase, partial [Caldiserica bacterium]|nr:phosphohydrolase [Caldisericota bacterium]
MSRKFVRENKAFFSAIAVLFTLLGLVIYFGGNHIYQSEIEWRHMNAAAQLISAEEVIQTFFTRFKKDVFFLRNLPCTVNYTNSNFNSLEYKKEVSNIFYEFARTYKEYYQIRIIDSSGKEVIRVNNKRDGTTVIVPDSQLQDKKHRYYFKEAIKLDKNQIYASPIDLNMEHGKVEIPYVPVIRLATPLFNLKDEKKGILIFNVSFSKVLEPLPRGTFVQTEEGNIIMLKPDGTVDFKKSRYKFNNSSGMINIS